MHLMLMIASTYGGKTKIIGGLTSMKERLQTACTMYIAALKMQKEFAETESEGSENTLG